MNYGYLKLQLFCKKVGYMNNCHSDIPSSVLLNTPVRHPEHDFRSTESFCHVVMQLPTWMLNQVQQDN